MRIRRLILDQVACFEHAEFEFPEGRDPDRAEVHVLVGQNGSGKSTVLMALAQVFAVEPTGVHQRFRSKASLVTVDGPFATVTMWAKVPGEQPPRAFLANGLLSEETNDLLFNWSTGSQLTDFRRDLAVDRTEKPADATPRFSHAAFAYGGWRSVGSFALRAIEELQSHPLRGACTFRRPQDDAELVRWIANTKAKEAFALARGDAPKAEQRRATLARVEATIAEITGQSFRFVLEDDPLWVGAEVGGAVLELDVLPDGLKSILSWVADLLMRMDRVRWVDDTPVTDRPFFLFLDEVENHLHPAWQRKVLPTVQRLFPRAQVFLSTHSPFVIASAEDAWIHPLHLTDRGAEAGAPLESRVGASYVTVLREVLGIDTEFSLQVEQRLDAFYVLRNKALMGDDESLERMRAMVGELQGLGEEVLAIALPELRQVERRLARASGTGGA